LTSEDWHEVGLLVHKLENDVKIIKAKIGFGDLELRVL